MEIINEMDRLANQKKDEQESFRDADHDEILYQKALHEEEHRPRKSITYLIVAIIFLVLLRWLYGVFYADKAWKFFNF